MSADKIQLLRDRQASMRRLATGLLDGTMTRKTAADGIKELITHERKSATASRATMDRSDHDHVKRSNAAAIRNRETTIEALKNALAALRDQETEKAAEFLTEAANAGGKRQEKAARKTPTVALYVQYLCETDPDFQAWLAQHGVNQ